jgi:hypothetical protein
MTAITSPEAQSIGTLLRGQPEVLGEWIQNWTAKRLLFCVAVIFAGAGLYGGAMGWWRAPEQGLIVAIKFPLIILLTTLGNALLNGMLAPLLGLNIGLRQSLLAILMSFTIAAAILGSFSPLTAFVVWNAPPLSDNAQFSNRTYAFIQVMHVCLIAFAGTAANVRLVQLLRQLSGKAAVARRVLFAWLAGNLFLGSQLCWIFRPFIGQPALAVAFFRAHPLQGNFYETLFNAIRQVLGAD